MAQARSTIPVWQVRFLIEHKSISRKHFVIEVEKVKEGDGAHIYSRSKVTVTDLNSKGGTQVDGKPLKNGSQVLNKVEHFLKPGSYPTPLQIKWNSVILTFSLTPKELKTRDPLKPKRDRLEQLDIKTILEYVTKSTTHVVAAKRNTAKGLQALINCQYIVDEPYIDALVYATTPADLAEEENASPLEQDFDTAWPKPKDFLPPAGKEPTVQPPESYAPNPQRENIFESYIFVFVDQAQHETLMPVINAGHGKALLYNVTPGETTVEDVVMYMRNAARDKGFGDPQEDSNNGGVVMVRYNKVEKEWDRWFNDLLNGVSFALDQRSIAQSEFLDAILANQPSQLRRSLEFNSTVQGTAAPRHTAASFARSRPPPSSQSRQTSPVRINSTPVMQSPPDLPGTQPPAREASSVSQEPPKKRSRLRGLATTRIKAFDDEFDADSIPSFIPDDDGPFPDAESQSQNNLDDPLSDSVPSVKEEREQGCGILLKRSRPASESEEDMVDELLPAATAMKRRKLELDMDKGELGQTLKAKARSFPVIKPKKGKQIDLREVAKQRRMAEEEAERKERERDEMAFDEIEQVKPANLVVVEEMALRVRNYPTSRATEDGKIGGDRWDERWNGRKNFKKFRRRGDMRAEPRRGVQNVMVPLVEVKKHSYGIGEQYWDHDNDGESESRKKIKKDGRMTVTHSQMEVRPQGRSQLQNQTQMDNGKEEEGGEGRSLMRRRLEREAVEIISSVDVDSLRRTRLADKTQSQNGRPKKRPTSGAGAASTKKQKTIHTRPASDESDSDDLKFRFGTRDRT